MENAEGERRRIEDLEGSFKSYDSLCLELDICVKCVCQIYVLNMCVKVCVEFVVGGIQ